MELNAHIGGTVAASNSPVAMMASLNAADTALLHGALDASDQHVLITDRKGRIVFANLALAERHGRARDELIGETVEQIMRTDNHSPAQLQEMREAMRTSRSIRVVVQGVHSSGSPTWPASSTPIGSIARTVMQRPPRSRPNTC